MDEQFLKDALNRQYGEALTSDIFGGMSGTRRTTLRANTLKTTAEAVGNALTGAGIGWKKAPFYADAFLLTDADERAVRALPMYGNGEIYLQGLSSMLPPLALAPREKADILDMAAAPGSKTTQLAALTCNRAQITACEIDKIRADRLRHNLAVQGARANVMVQDARKLEDFFRFDQILLDAPCSGSGTLLFSLPATTRAFSQALVKNSAALQKALLQKALTMLKAGGEMVYSTCSVLQAENEEVVRTALKSRRAELVPIDPPSGLPLLPTAVKGCICVRPTGEYEGFFMAKLRKSK